MGGNDRIAFVMLEQNKGGAEENGLQAERKQSKPRRPNLPSEQLLTSPGRLLSAVHVDRLDSTNTTKDKTPVRFLKLSVYSEVFSQSAGGRAGLA